MKVLSHTAAGVHGSCNCEIIIKENEVYHYASCFRLAGCIQFQAPSITNQNSKLCLSLAVIQDMKEVEMYQNVLMVCSSHICKMYLLTYLHLQTCILQHANCISFFRNKASCGVLDLSSLETFMLRHMAAEVKFNMPVMVGSSF